MISCKSLILCVCVCVFHLCRSCQCLLLDRVLTGDDLCLEVHSDQHQGDGQRGHKAKLPVKVAGYGHGDDDGEDGLEDGADAVPSGLQCVEACIQYTV